MRDSLQPCHAVVFLVTLTVSFKVDMGKTAWQASWCHLVDKNGDRFEEYLVKVDDEYAKYRYVQDPY